MSQKKLENGEWKILIDARKCDIYPPKYKQEGKSTEMRRLWQLWDQLIVHEGLLYRKFLDCKNSSNVQLQLVVETDDPLTITAEFGPNSLREGVYVT